MILDIKQYFNSNEELDKLIEKYEKSGLELNEAHSIIKLLISELKLYRQALTKAVSLPKGVLPDTKDFYTVMFNGNCKVISCQKDSGK